MLDKITKESLEKLDRKLEMIPLTFDLMFKNVFERNEYAFKRFLISVLHFNLKPEDCKIRFRNTELPMERYRDYHKTVDFNIIINERIFVNVELNNKVFKDIKKRNILYHHTIASTMLDKGDDINKLNTIKNIQLNLNNGEKAPMYGEEEICYYNKTRDEVYDENDIIYLRYLEYYRRLYYNKNISDKKESDYWLAAITAKNFSELNEILSKFLTRNLREKIINDVYRLSMEEFMVSEEILRKLALVEDYDTARNREEEFQERLEKSLKKAKRQAIKEGLQQGLQQGIEQGIEIVVKNMLSKGTNIETISEYTGLSKEKIEDIKSK